MTKVLPRWNQRVPIFHSGWLVSRCFTGVMWLAHRYASSVIDRVAVTVGNCDKILYYCNNYHRYTCAGDISLCFSVIRESGCVPPKKRPWARMLCRKSRELMLCSSLKNLFHWLKQFVEMLSVKQGRSWKDKRQFCAVVLVKITAPSV